MRSFIFARYFSIAMVACAICSNLSVYAGTTKIIYDCDASTKVCHEIRGNGMSLGIQGTLKAGYPKIIHEDFAQPPIDPGYTEAHAIFLADPKNPEVGWGYVKVSLYVDANGNSNGEIYADDNSVLVRTYSEWKALVETNK